MITIRKITRLSHSYRNIKRFRQILHVFVKYGFGNLVEHLGVDKFLMEIGNRIIPSRSKERLGRIPQAVRLRMALAKLGPTFIKFGQILATRPDLIPIEYTRELTKLQDSAPLFPYEQVKEIIKSETGKDPKDLFDDFDEVPLAAASIAQVHRACYKGKQVVVKVQRPKIKEVIETDIEIMYHIALLLEKHILEFSIQKPSAIINEFAKSLEKEIDFLIELKQTERFANCFSDDDTIYTPKIYKDISTARVLVIEYIDGIKSSDVKKLKKEKYDLSLLAERGANSLLKQIFEEGYFHGDPHPGNIFIMPENIICFIDFGMMGVVSEQEREMFSGLLMQIINKKNNKIIDYILKFTQYDIEPDSDELQRSITEIIDEYLFQPMKYMEFGKFLEKLLEILADNHLRMRPNLFLMMKALVSLEKLARSLDPNMNIIQLAAPYVKKIYLDRFNIKKIILNMGDPLYDLLNLVAEMPEDIRTLLKQLKKGKLKIDLEYLGFEKMRSTIIKISNRIVCAIILAALLIGNSLMMLAKAIPANYHIRLLGLVGFIISGVLGAILLISVILARNK